ncbi:Fbox domain WD G-beta repeat-containing [Brachionus plicatilis]|uniref:Fbox domain WD G-beta repeat-containing n=1 Tax=Brachionus plicatilis TaxID=10195 RepID=A0A3M7RN32_BRAPC|nr:Fbox domain WD G-beta repeat-containing [Brachionus plicatilis]
MEEITLRLDSCEKWTKYKNLMNNKGDLICPECIRTHTVNVEQTLKRTINQEKIKRKKIEMAFESFSQDNLDLKIEDHFDNLKNKIDLHVEELIKKINDLRIDMIEKIDQKRKEFIEDINNVGFQQFNKEKFSEEIDNISDIPEKLDIEDNYLSNIEKMESQINKILIKLDKNKFERNNSSNKIEKLVGIFKLTEKIRKNGIIGALEDIKEIESKNFKISDLSKTTNGYTNSVWCLQLIDQFTLAAGSADNLIKIWDFRNYYWIDTLEGHTNSVRCLQLIDKSTLVSGSADKTIKIWDLRNTNCVNTLEGHTEYVSCLQLIDQITLASGSADKTIKIWDLRNFNCINTLKGHTKSVRCLQLIDQFTLGSGSYVNTELECCRSEQFRNFFFFFKIIELLPPFSFLNDLKKKEKETNLNRKPIFNHPFIYLIPDITEWCFVTAYS